MSLRLVGFMLGGAALLSGAALAAGCQDGGKKGEAALVRADAAATRFGGTLRARLVAAMAEGGPARAIELCAGEAQAMRADVARDARVSLGRSSLRLRAQEDAAPAWVAEWMRTSGERKAEGATGVRAVFDTPAGKVARVLRPIAIEAPCLACHGDATLIDAKVLAQIRARYPGDTALGYHVGDLRGALWVEAAVE